ncbi:MAG: hypothetical protein K8I60_03985 [Anaerolineae bacterium]|nr:hypothetical protein [Anaerolineae bacterium]
MPRTDAQIEDLLAAVTDALLMDDSADLDTIVTQYNVPRSDVAGLVTLISRLHVLLVGARPSSRFVRRLKRDLMGAPERGMVYRIRHLPPRVQIAAGVALIAGFMIITRRRMVDDAQSESQEVAVLQQ